MKCPFHPEEGIQYCWLQIELVKLHTGFEIMGYRYCVGQDKCPIINHKLEG
jgi:hypothetical protein